MRQKILLEKLENMVYSPKLLEYLLPMETFLCDITVIAVSEADAAKLKLGQSISPKNYGVDALVGAGTEDGILRDVRADDGLEAVAMFDGKLVAVVRIDERRIAPVRVFNL